MKKVPYCNTPGTLIKNLLWRPFRPTVSAPVNESIFYQLQRLPQNKFIGWLVGCFSMDYRLMTTERAVEVPFAFQHLALPEGARILDFGCCESKLAIELASLGYKVMGVDGHDYELRHPHLSVW